MSAIAASELILRPDGSVYHLGLRPEHLAPLVVTVGDPERVPRVSRHFDAVEARLGAREFVAHVGRFAGRRILCVSTGVGTDNVDIVLNELDALANVDFGTRSPAPDLRRLTFVRIGTSGTMRGDVPLDATVVSARAVGLDGLGPHYAFPGAELADALRASYPSWAAAAYAASASGELVDAWRGRGVVAGTTLTCAGFYGPQRRRLRLPFAGPTLAELARWRPAGRIEPAFANFEMETAGLYGLAALLGHRAVSLSAILANRVTGAFSGRPAATVEALIAEAFAAFGADPGLWWGE